MHAQILALGPELRAFAREFTDDLNEACYLTHRVVSRLLSDPQASERPVDVQTARALLLEAAKDIRSDALKTA